MINTVYLLGVFAALFVDITALALLVYRTIPLPATARTVGIVGLCAALFSIEHFVGLGDLSVAFIPLTATAAYVLWRDWRRGSDQAFSDSQYVFFVAFLFCMFFRRASPDIVEDNDRLTDFHLVANYMAGTKLPPLDYWFPSQTLDYYYTFQQVLRCPARPVLPA